MRYFRKGEALNTQPKNDAVKSSEYNTVSDMEQLIFASISRRNYDIERKEDPFRMHNRIGHCLMRYQQKAPLQYVSEMGRPNRVDLRGNG